MNSLLDRLKERKLVQWALAYLAGAWVLLQVVDLVGNQFAWPGVVMRGTTVVLAVGFFAALILAWYHGEQGRQQVSGPELLMLAAVLAIAGAAVTWVSRSDASSAEAAAAATRLRAPDDAASNARSIAVLPFTNLSADPENEYFSDGITEDILTHLSKIGDLRVISRTSIMRYKNTDKSLREIARELEVAHILEGSVRRAGERVRITAQLINARNDEHLWAETYDRELRDIFQIQSEIAQKIAAALEAELSPAEQRRIEAPPTENLTAYDFYLQGRAYYYRYQKEANETAAQLFKRAIALDSSFALAWAGLGDAYAIRVNRFGEPHAWTDSAIAAAQKAVALDPELAEAHKALGTAYSVRGWYGKAVEPLERAIALNPNYWQAIGNIGVLKAFTGQWDEALRWYRRGLSGDPMGRATALGNIAFDYGILGMLPQSEHALQQARALQPDLPQVQRTAVWLSLLREEHAQAVEQSKKLLASNPTDAAAWALAGDAYLLSGNYQQAREHFERVHAISPTAESLGRYVPVLLGYTFWKAGERERAQRLFEEYRAFARGELEKGNQSWLLRYNLAAVHAIRGEKAEAHRWLQEAQKSGWTEYYFSRQDPLLENLHGDPEFQRIMAQQKARIDQMRQRVEREGW